jgi:hypothetical protein
VTLPCFVCDRELASAIDPANAKAFGIHNQPWDANVFKAHGHYGSTVFDPSPAFEGNVFLELNICCKCMLERKDKILIVRAEQEVTYDPKPWDGSGP